MNSRHSWRRCCVVVSGLAAISLLDKKELVAQDQEGLGEDAYHYALTGKRDPFTPPFSTAAPETVDSNEPKTPLQRFDLGQLKLVGVIWETDEPKALVEDSGGLGYIIMRGTLIGSRGGVVKMIEPKRVIIEEYETDFFGKRQIQKKELRLVVTDSSQEQKKESK
jgi:Tfp pilus assembly protein PilP